MCALAQELQDRIWDLETVDGIWKQKMGNLLPKIEKALHEKLTPALNDSTPDGKELQAEIFRCTEEIKQTMLEYEKELIEYYGNNTT